jgi:hypothetical protein
MCKCKLLTYRNDTYHNLGFYSLLPISTNYLSQSRFPQLDDLVVGRRGDQVPVRVVRHTQHLRSRPVGHLQHALQLRRAHVEDVHHAVLPHAVRPLACSTRHRSQSGSYIHASNINTLALSRPFLYGDTCNNTPTHTKYTKNYLAATMWRS